MILRIFTFSFLLTLFANAGQCAAFPFNISEVNSINVRFGTLPTTVPAEPYIPGEHDHAMCIFRSADITNAVKQIIADHRRNPTEAFEMALNFSLDATTLTKVRDLFRDAAYEDKLTSLHLVKLTSPTLPDDIFAGFSNLRNLTIGYMLLPTNVLEKLSPRTFSGLRSLEVLSIHDRNLRSIEDGAFTDLVSLRELALTTCIKLKDLPMDRAMLPNLTHLNIGMTPHAYRFCLFQELPATDRLLHAKLEQFRSSRHTVSCWHLRLSKPETAADGSVAAADAPGAVEVSVYSRFIQQLALLPENTAADAASAVVDAADAADDASSVTSSGSGPQAPQILMDGRGTTGPVRITATQH